MGSKPRVSVIIPFFNSERFLSEAIKSVFAQTYNDWELLLVDDGSFDGSSQIARGYVEKSPTRIIYLEHASHQNRGACASRNLGVRNASGEYIALLDSDDVWLPNKLERQVAILDRYAEAAMVYGTAQYWRSWTGTAEDVESDYVPDFGLAPIDTLVPPPTLLMLYLRSRARTPCPSSLLLRSEAVQSVGGFEENFRGTYQLYEDQAFLAKVFVKKTVFVMRECLIRYRLHAESCVSLVKAAKQKYTIGLFYLKWLEEYLAREGIQDSEIRRSLHDKRWHYRHANLRHRHPRLSRVLGLARHLVRN
jgi:glycosyltransferase involved in cell wall biosynthesis